MLPGKIIYSPNYRVSLEGHVVPTEKYDLIKERLIQRKLADHDDFLEPGLPSDELVLLVHDREYLEDLKAIRVTRRTWRSELPVNTAVIHSALYSVSGTVLATEQARQHRFGIHLGGGYHHAFPDHGEGFCYLNDVAIAVRDALNRGFCQRAAVVDCDLHQGNGTAAIFAEDPRVMTFSIHQEDIYPTKEKSSLDIGLAAGTGDLDYLRQLERGMDRVVRFKPDFIFYLAGTDPYKYDKLGGLLLTKEGMKQRDQLVLVECAKREIPCVITLAGGYAIELEDTVQLHTQTVAIALSLQRSHP